MPVKTRIMSRIEIARKLLDVRDKKDDTDYRGAQDAVHDMAFHLIADGIQVKVFHDPDMGGTVVELPDE